MQKSGQWSHFYGPITILAESFILRGNAMGFFNLCNAFVSEYHTMPSVSGPMGGYSVNPRGSREFLFCYQGYSKSANYHYGNLNGLTVRMLDFFYVFSH